MNIKVSLYFQTNACHSVKSIRVIIKTLKTGFVCYNFEVCHPHCVVE